MACFSVPVASAVAAAAAGKAHKKSANPFLQRLDWFIKMSFGGGFLLAIEHVYHGEIIFSWPFLTAMKNPADTREMLLEMATSGVAMTALLFVVWVGMVLVSIKLNKNKCVR